MFESVIVGVSGRFGLAPSLARIPLCLPFSASSGIARSILMRWGETDRAGDVLRCWSSPRSCSMVEGFHLCISNLLMDSKTSGST